MKYYVYQLEFPNGIPFYIGQSVNPVKRYKEHLGEARNDSTSIKASIIRVIQSTDRQPRLNIVFTTDDKPLAHIIEAMRVTKYSQTVINARAGENIDWASTKEFAITPRNTIAYTQGLKAENCLRCGYDWQPRTLHIAACPRCKSTAFRKAKVSKISANQKEK